MMLRTSLRAVATILMLSNVSHAMEPEGDHSAPDVTSSDTWARTAAASSTDGAFLRGSNGVIVLLDHEGDSFVWPDAIDHPVTGGAAELAVDPELLEALQATTAWDLAIPLQESFLAALHLDITGSTGQLSNPFAVGGYEDR
jgi:hypothetical protein